MKNRTITILAMFTILTLALSTLLGGYAPLSADGTDGPMAESKVSHKLTGTVPEWAVKARNRYTFDFTENDITYYSQHDGLQLMVRTGLKISDGRLLCEKNKNFTIATRNALGDDYGIEGGSAGFTLSITGGSVSVLLRDQGPDYKKTDSGLRLKFEAGKLTVTDDFTKKKAEADISGYTENGREVKAEITDRPTGFSVSLNGTAVLVISYTEKASLSSGYSVSNYGSELVFYDGNGKEIGRSSESKLQRAGRMLLMCDKLEGYIDDLYFDRTDIDQSLPETGETRTIDYGNWVAADDLSRVTVLNGTTDTIRTDRYVGMFYFLCWVGAGIHVQDNTKIYLEQGAQGLKSYLEKQGGEAYWAEPYFGYYRNSDAWVYRKHAYMLEAAGIDFIFLDVSNREVFTSGHTLLFDTWLQIRKEGGHTPQICFLTGDDPKTFDADVRNLQKSVYSEKNWDKYKELFFMWEGKPLIFGNINGVSDKIRTYLEENFTVRGCWAWCDEDGYWTWMDETWRDAEGNYVQHKGRDLNGNFEEMSVTAGHHASSSKGRSYVNGIQPNNKANDFMFSYDESRKGLGFASQFEAAIKADPPVIMITGWNEWIAGNGRGSNYIALTSIKDVCYVDEFNPEFSRDIEPMKLRTGVGFGDNFYYQTVDYVRKFKGTDTLKVASNQKTIGNLGDVSLWSDVGPEFRDTIGDVEFRDTYSYDRDFKYINGTGRNDIDAAKVSQDADYLYFMVRTVNDIVAADDATWMNLLIDSDMDHSTGWEGYDYIINRSRTGNAVSVEKFDGGSWNSVRIGEADHFTAGKYLTVRVDKTLLGWNPGDAANFDFKWTDNSTETGEIMEFMDLGDTAPNDRFNFRYVADAERYEKSEAGQNGSGNEPVKDKGGFNPVPVIVVAATVLLAAAAAVVIVKNKKN